MALLASNSAQLFCPRQCQQKASFRGASTSVSHRKIVIVASSPVDADAELEKRLDLLKRQNPKKKEEEKPAPTKSGKKSYDYTDEVVHYEGPPSRGDLALNLALAGTLLWLPLTIAAVGRAAFVKYRFTDRRLSVVTQAPWQVEQVDVAYQEVANCVTVGRAMGLWGDLVITLKDTSVVEMRSLDKYMELKKYVLERRDALTEKSPEQLLMEDEETGVKPKKKGFA